MAGSPTEVASGFGAALTLLVVGIVWARTGLASAERAG